MSYVGQPLKRFEDPRLITGQGSFVDDMKLPGMLHACVLRSPHAHARIRSIDVSAARDLPGVAAVLTGDDVQGIIKDLPTRRMSGELQVDELNAPVQPVLAMGKVNYAGQPVAIVAAEDRYLAQDAMELILVDYEPLTPIVDALEAAAEGSVPIHEDLGSNIVLRIHHDRQGKDLDVAFDEADRVVRQQYFVQRLAPVPLETRGLIADYQPRQDLLTVWASTQRAHGLKSALAFLLDRAEDGIRVVAPDVGGSFGEKGGTFAEYPLVAYLSLTLGRPVKWVADRQENMLGFHGRGHNVDIEAAVKNDGTITGIRLKIVSDSGAYFVNSTPSPPYRASHRIIGPYLTPNARVDVLGVVTNKPPTGAYRGAGGPESAFCMERTVDLIARELDLDPAEVRRRNLIPPDAFPYLTPTGLTYDSGNYEVVLDRALEMADYQGWREKARQSRNSGGPLIGVGLATVIKMSGGSGESRTEEALIKIDPSGQTTAFTGISPHGQGSETSFAQIVADEIGVHPSDVRVLHGDTATIPEGGGTGSTRGTVVGGPAMYLAAQGANQKLSEIAAHLMDCSPDDVTFLGGRVTNRRNPGQELNFAQVASASYNEELLPPEMEAGLEFKGSFTLGAPYQSPHAFGTHVVVVEVDPENGAVKTLKYVAVHDCGRIINPMLVEGQVHGAIAQGIGQALLESMVYSPEGQPLSASLMDYALPRALDIPNLETDTFETPSPLNPLGIKGVGELPTVAAPVAVANAVMDALWAKGVRHIDTPLTPEKIRNALQEQESIKR